MTLQQISTSDSSGLLFSWSKRLFNYLYFFIFWLWALKC